MVLRLPLTSGESTLTLLGFPAVSFPSTLRGWEKNGGSFARLPLDHRFGTTTPEKKALSMVAVGCARATRSSGSDIHSSYARVPNSYNSEARSDTLPNDAPRYYT